VKYQLAGDLYEEPTRDQLVASGFNRLHLIIDRGTALPEESYTRNVIDRVTAVGTAFMGLTVQCAVCHDHKYDPITQKDFYQLFAFFNNFDGEPETGGRSGSDFQRGLQPPYISLATATQRAELVELEDRIQGLQQQLAELAKQTDESDQERESTEKSEVVKGSATRRQSPQKTALQKTLEQTKAEKKAWEASIDYAMVMKERAQRRPAYLLIRGAYDKPGEEVQPDTPAFLPPMKDKQGASDRLDLAEWFVSRDQPLTARVAVNRFWQQLFGVGIVKTSEDFGAQGQWPSHPQLLDYLATSFIDSGWNIKALMKQIVMSQTYRQSSVASPKQFQRDPENRLLARGSRFRLDAEVIRDQILATSGLLNDRMYGKSVKPPQPPGLWQAVSMPSSYPRVYKSDTGDKIYRRSLYTFWKRGMPPPQMTILNAPTREACIARRERTNTPLQALLLMNEAEYLKAARHLAHRTLQRQGTSPEERLAIIYETVTARLPDSAETETFLAMQAELKAMYEEAPELADQLCRGMELGEHDSPARLAAWTMVASAIYNLDITKTRE